MKTWSPHGLLLLFGSGCGRFMAFEPPSFDQDGAPIDDSGAGMTEASVTRPDGPRLAPVEYDCTKGACSPDAGGNGVTCPPGRDCLVRCAGQDACTIVRCPADHACFIECADAAACKYLHVRASTAAYVCLQLGGDPTDDAWSELSCSPPEPEPEGESKSCEIECSDSRGCPWLPRCAPTPAQCARASRCRL